MSYENKSDRFREPVDGENRRLKAIVVGSGRTRVQLELRVQGRDFLILVTGGRAHVGAVATWDGSNNGPVAVVTELPGHREGPLAGECATAIGSATTGNVAAVVGIHQDNATTGEIAAIVGHVREGLAELVDYLQRWTTDTAEPTRRDPGYHS